MDTTGQAATNGVIAIHDYDYQSWTLPQKLSWLAVGAGSGGTFEASGALSNLGDSLTQADANLRQAAAKAGIDWQGSAAEAAGSALTRAGQRGADVGTAHTGGATTVTEYGTSFGGLSSTMGTMKEPEYGFWDKAVDQFSFLGLASDHKKWVDNASALEAEADTALKNHEIATRAALDQVPTLAAAAPTTTGGAAGAGDRVGGGGARVGRAGAAAVPAPGGAGTAGATTAPGGGEAGPATGGTGGTGATIPAPAGGDPAGTTGGPGPSSPSVPLIGDPGATSQAAYDPGVQMPIQQVPNPSGATSWVPPAPSATTGGSLPIGGSLLGPDPLRGLDGAVPGRRVSSGPEFGAKLPGSWLPGTGLPGTGTGERGRAAFVEPAAAGRAGAQGAHGVAGTPMMGGMGGRGGDGQTRQAKYVVPSSAAFDPPLQPHVVGVIGPEDDDEPY